MPAAERYTLLIVEDDETDDTKAIIELLDETKLEFQVKEEEDCKEICRLCLTQATLYSLTSSQYAQQFNNFNFIEAQIGYKLPDTVCKKCITQLDEIGSFLAKCRDSYISCNALEDAAQLQNSLENETNKVVEIKKENCDSESEEYLEIPVEVKLESVDSPDLKQELDKVLLNVEDEPTHVEKNVNNDELDKLKLCHKCGLLVTRLTVHYRKSFTCWPKVKKKCLECNLYFADQRTLNGHKQLHEADKVVRKRIMCHICSKMFTNRRNLDRHVKVHKYGKEFICDVCGKGFTRRTFLNYHKNVHSASRPYRCEQCGLNYMSSNSLRLHQASKHRSNLPPEKLTISIRKPLQIFTCPICNRQMSKKGLKRHMETHDDYEIEKPLLCKECNILFETPTELREHHSTCENRRFKCSCCLKRFKDSIHLEYHIRTHTGVRPFSCPKCDSRFRTETHLKRHTMTIHGINRGEPYSCKICSKTFNMKYSLVAHERVHTGERPYSCHVCEKKFTDASGRRKHVKKYHGDSEVKNIVPVVL